MCLGPERERDAAGFGLGAGKPEERGKPKPTKAGISLKRMDMPICDRLSRFWEKEDVGVLAETDAAKQTQET